MDKQFKEQTVFHKIDYKKPIIICSDIMSKFKIGDRIQSGYEEAHYSSDSGYDGHYYFTIVRKILETDKEFEYRKEQFTNLKEESKKRRYTTYLKLKQEFEND